MLNIVVAHLFSLLYILVNSNTEFKKSEYSSVTITPGSSPVPPVNLKIKNSSERQQAFNLRSKRIDICEVLI